MLVKIWKDKNSFCVLLMEVFISTASLKSDMKLIDKLSTHVPYDSASTILSILSRTFLCTSTSSHAEEGSKQHFLCH